MATMIDPRAVVSPKARLGVDVRIDAFAIIEDDVVIGDRSHVGPYVVVHDGSRIGSDNRFHPNASIGGPPQDLKYKGEPTLLEVGNNNVFRECTTINRGTVETGRTSIGNNCFFMAYCHVAHDCVVGDKVIMANCVPLGGHVHVGDWVILGGMSAVHQFCKIGAHAMVASGAMVVKDIPPFVLTGRTPTCYEGLNLVGLRRRGFTAEQIQTIEKAYSILYLSSLNVTQAANRLREEMGTVPEVRYLLDFIAASKRGLIPGPRH